MLPPPVPSALVLCSAPPAQVPLLANQMPAAVVPQLLAALGELIPSTPHIEYLLRCGAALSPGGTQLALCAAALDVRDGTYRGAAHACMLPEPPCMLHASRSLRWEIERSEEDTH